MDEAASTLTANEPAAGDVEAPRPAGLAEARAVLKRVWGYDDFRPGQDEVVAAILRGDDALAIMPTGGGKSLCYQLPALIRPGLTVVVSPLIALMQDQVAALRAQGVEAGALMSTNTPDEAAEIRSKLWDGALRLLYCSPERLALGDTAAMLTRVGVSLLAVDEAHCVAQWGHDFRPDYLGVGAFRHHLEQAGGPVQVAAFTATADEGTREEIVEKLFARAGGDGPKVFVRGFDRPNLRLAFEPKAKARDRLLSFVKAHAGQAGIVYCASRKGVEKLAEHLNANGAPALPYHAGLAPEIRAENQRAFVEGDGVVMVATIAFGMGVDKPDVRFVAHADLPKTVESYYQEIGRAGRDGLPANTLTLYGFEDMKLRRRQIEQSEAPEPRKRAERARLSSLLALAEAPVCRRQTLLAYFGEKRAEPCGACDLCDAPPETYDGRIEAQKALSAMARTGERFGVEHLIAILIGEPTDNVEKFGHHNLPTFGVGRDQSRAHWRAVYRQLMALGLVDIDASEYGRWRMTVDGRAAMKGARDVRLRKDATPPPGARKGGGKAALDALESDADNALFRALKRRRTELAQALKVPAYVVFTDRTLIDIALKRPANADALSECHGVGEAKLKKFGDAVLEIVKKSAA